MMCHVMDNPANCNICAVNLLLHPKQVRAAEIHHKSCAHGLQQTVVYNVQRFECERVLMMKS
jgi:hypothetical protein